MLSFLTVIIIVITKIICSNCQEGINYFFPPNPISASSFLLLSLFALATGCISIKGIFEHANKPLALHSIRKDE